jgi:uncharacterized membrane protein YhaH (DUF805 family)
MTFPQPPRSLNEPPLNEPLYGASFGAAFRRFWKKYATFSGRASRGEFWWAYLGVAIIFFGAEIVAGIVIAAYVLIAHASGQSQDPSPFGLIVSLLVTVAVFGILIPQLAITVRRLHDTNRSGWYILMGCIPWAGGIILLVFTVGETNPAGARFDLGMRARSVVPASPPSS